jgi:hypothetical protein
LIPDSNIDVCCEILTSFLDCNIVISKNTLNLITLSAVKQQKLEHVSKIVKKLVWLKHSEMIELDSLVAELVQQNKIEEAIELASAVPLKVSPNASLGHLGSITMLRRAGY